MISELYAYQAWQRKLEAAGYRVVHEPTNSVPIHVERRRS